MFVNGFLFCERQEFRFVDRAVQWDRFVFQRFAEDSDCAAVDLQAICNIREGGIGRIAAEFQFVHRERGFTVADFVNNRAVDSIDFFL